jgi:hypothetical protein
MTLLEGRRALALGRNIETSYGKCEANAPS